MRAAKRILILLTTTAALCVAVTGCGGSSSNGAGAAPSNSSAALAFSRCIRAHGVSGFPDPGTPVTGPANMIGGIEIPSSIDTQAPAYQAAQQDCGKFLSAAIYPQGKPRVTAAMKSKLIEHAQCMRDNGVPSFPDPTFPASGGIAITDAGTDPQSPAYVHAQSVCGNR